MKRNFNCDKHTQMLVTNVPNLIHLDNLYNIRTKKYDEKTWKVGISNLRYMRVKIGVKNTLRAVREQGKIHLHKTLNETDLNLAFLRSEEKRALRKT